VSVGKLVCNALYAGPVTGLELDLGPGITVITGDFGCGTSTLLRLLAGVQEPDSGTVERSSVALLEAPPGHEWADHDVVQRALEAPHLVGREMWAMSAGERQRARLANLLASDAEVLLLDEPLGLLDARGRGQVMDALRADGRPMLVACKSDESVLPWADRVLVMRDGRLS
jgi:energy-coupling factor transporter ATP-binding protein EcfA2